MLNLFIRYLCSLSLALLPFVSHADYQPEPKFVAETVTSMMNRYATFGELLAELKPFLMAADVADFESMFQKAGGKLTDKIPKVKAEGTEIVFEQDRIVVLQGRAFRIKDKTYRMHGKGLSGLFQEILEDSQGRHTSSFSLFPEAHAMGIVYAVPAAVAAIIGFTLLVFGPPTALIATGIKSFVNDKKTGFLRCEGFGNRGPKFDPPMTNEAASVILNRPVTKCTGEILQEMRTKLIEIHDHPTPATGEVSVPISR